MDQDALVADAQTLTRKLDETKVAPLGVMWVTSEETDTWRLWISPKADMDKREFYEIVASSISHSDIQNLDVGMVEMTNAKRFETMGISPFIRIGGITKAVFKSNVFNGVSMPDGIIIRMNI